MRTRRGPVSDKVGSLKCPVLVSGEWTEVYRHGVSGEGLTRSERDWGGTGEIPRAPLGVRYAVRLPDLATEGTVKRQ